MSPEMQKCSSPGLLPRIADITIDRKIPMQPKPNFHTVLIMSSCDEVMGSGTAIRIADRLFIASAAHVIEQLGSLEVSILSRSLEEGRTVKVADSGSRGEPYDIGYLELPPEKFPKIFANALLVEEIELADNVHSEGLPIVLCGYPREWFNMDEKTFPLTLKTTSFAFSTRVIGPEKWPPEWQQDVHLAIDLNPSENVDLKGERVTRPHPKGMSGGGLWRVNELKILNLWTPIQFNWAGIQVSYHSELKLAKGTLSCHWLNLIREQKPELSDYLQG